VTAETAEGLVMGFRHRDIPSLEGVQFHPESILTEHGHQLLANFLGSPNPPAPFPTGEGGAGRGYDHAFDGAEVLAHAY
jgi:hypothetical protein